MLSIFLSFKPISLSQVYKAFEEQVLSGTGEYYSKDGETAIQKFYVEGKSFVEYMKYVQNRLNDELKRAKLLHPSSQSPLMQLCCKILIEKHIDAFDSEFTVGKSIPLQPSALLKWLVYFLFLDILKRQ